MQRVIAAGRRWWIGLVSLVAVLGVAAVRPDPVVTMCPPLSYGWQRMDPSGVCLPTLFPVLTGANALPVVVSWIFTWAAVAAALWFVVTFIRTEGDI
jgi:hypothetical protein